ncbi:helix-turn-helix transcriptional regulator [Streptomyces iconiensis]|uniref:Helix-turn-helix transcriptional regulator n=1 Tax=Streptomyces iconiensis TaxID=1384038 RepID=A0ABT6ZUW7_9ACTN|nr:helix-turn-helix transcriptional regulator [Streptomyces iconiensis]MDJ1132843.1 helix-turn-helix transcriptional regulator [Streptomyces iconiensis]
MGTVVGDSIKQRREALGWTQGKLAREACGAAGVPNDALTKQDIYRYETGRRTPRDWLPAIAVALGTSLEDLRKTRESALSSPAALPVLHRAAGSELAPTIRELNQRLVVLDNEMYGLPIAETAARAFKTVHRRLGNGEFGTRNERDIQSAAAELAEIAGWALFSGGRFKDSRRFSQEALFLAQVSGDRGIELLSLQNLALLAGWTGRPREELSIAQAVIERGCLNPRVEALFRAREGQGLGRAGDPRCRESFARARSLLQECAPTDAPEWAWWVSEREIDRQHGRVLSVVGSWAEAIPVLQRATDERNGPHVGYGIAASVWLIDCFLSVGAWADARETAESFLPAVTEIASVVTRDNLERVIAGGLSAEGLPGDVRDVLCEIKKGLEEGPYTF